MIADFTRYVSEFYPNSIYKREKELEIPPDQVCTYREIPLEVELFHDFGRDVRYRAVVCLTVPRSFFP